jgi:hypothetical protein
MFEQLRPKRQGKVPSVVKAHRKVNQWAVKFVPVPGHWGTFRLSMKGASHGTTTLNLHE